MSRDRFQSLDGLRGIVALVVVATHAGRMFAGHFRVSHGYLAVDFFFLLSGFVLTHAYGERLRDGLAFGVFLKLRMIRLYPLAALGVAIGALDFMFIQTGRNAQIGPAIIDGLLLYPTASAPTAGFSLWPLDPPTWSLFWEVIGSGIFGFWLWNVRTRRLVTIAIIAATSLSVLGLWFGTLELGFIWMHFVGGGARAAAGLIGGTLLFRIHAAGRITVSNLPTWLCALILILLMIGPAGGVAPTSQRAVYDLICALIIFPLIILLSASNPATSRFWRLGGQISYPIYILHWPVMLIAGQFCWTIGLGTNWQAISTGLLSTVLASYLALAYYDLPLRARLSRKRGRSGSIMVASAVA